MNNIPIGLLASAKRTAVERTGIHAWHPYYAGYSEAFVASALRYLSCSADTLVLDPWSGSGTTCAVSAKNGVPSIGIDINPVMATFAAAKSPFVLADQKKILRFFENLQSIKYVNRLEYESDPLNQIFTPKSVGVIRAIWREAARFCSSEGDIEVTDFDMFHSDADALPCIDAFVVSVIFVTLRKMTGIKKLANPTWVSNGQEKIAIDKKALIAELTSNAYQMLGSLELFYEQADSISEVYSLAASAGEMPLPSNSVDCVVTSPPYLTRIDYAVSTMPELHMLGIPDLFTSIRHATTGAPVITYGPKEQRKEWGVLCNSLLDRVKLHPTKAAQSYYWKNMVQYFHDIESALIEIQRVLKYGGKGLIVVQSSYFKDVEISLGEIFVEMAQANGFLSSIASRDVVKGHMAHVNTRSTKYIAGKIYFEDAVYIEKPKNLFV